MEAFMEAINYNSFAYMGLLMGIVGLIYVVLFTIVKINIKKQHS
jgi:hypothetical protein